MISSYRQFYKAFIRHFHSHVCVFVSVKTACLDYVLFHHKALNWPLVTLGLKPCPLICHHLYITVKYFILCFFFFFYSFSPRLISIWENLQSSLCNTSQGHITFFISIPSSFFLRQTKESVSGTEHICITGGSTLKRKQIQPSTTTHLYLQFN